MTALPHPGFLYTIASFIVVIGVLVTVHEYGHYLAGRWLGVKADVFSIGFGKELVGITDKRGTRWKIAALPLGGYVKFAGDANAASMGGAATRPEDRAHTLLAKPLWQRAVIIAAGPVTNFVFAILAFAVLFMTIGRDAPSPAPVVGVVEGAALDAGLKPGDRIVRVGDQPVARFDQLKARIASAHGRPVQLSVVRGDTAFDRVVTPRPLPGGCEGACLGIGPKFERQRLNPVRALGEAAADTAALVPQMAAALWQVATGERAFSELGGLPRIAQASGQAAAMGLATFVPFVAVISINLGFINLLPIPVLDGGHLAMYALEGLRRRPLSQRAQELAFLSGLAALFTFMVAKTLNDLGSFGIWHRLAGAIG